MLICISVMISWTTSEGNMINSLCVTMEACDGTYFGSLVENGAMFLASHGVSTIRDEPATSCPKAKRDPIVSLVASALIETASSCSSPFLCFFFSANIAGNMLWRSSNAHRRTISRSKKPSGQVPYIVPSTIP